MTNSIKFTAEQIAVLERFLGYCNHTSLSNRIEFRLGEDGYRHTDEIWTAEIQGAKAEDLDKFKAMQKVLDIIQKESEKLYNQA